MGFAVLAIFVGVPALLIGSLFITGLVATAKEEKKRKQEKQEEIKNTYDRILQKVFIRDSKRETKYDIIDFPQLTFEKWLSFYNTSPEKWEIDEDQYYREAYVPVYIDVKEHAGKNGHILKTETIIPTFWASPEDMQKYVDWVNNEYEHGTVKLYENRRDAQLEKLAACLQEDINERRKKIYAEYERVVDETEKIKKDIPQLTLTPATNQDVTAVNQQAYTIATTDQLHTFNAEENTIVYCTNEKSLYKRENGLWVKMT